MPKTTSRAPLKLTDDDRENLSEVSRSRKSPKREVERAKILLAYASGDPITGIAESVGVSRMTVYKCIDKALSMGTMSGLKDLYHRPHEPEIGDDAKAWVIHIACTKPKDLGLAAEVWSRSALARYVREHAREAGYPSLGRAGKSTVHRILNERSLHPEKIRYYLERRDPEFESKMVQLVLIYEEVHLEIESGKQGDTVTVCVDEKPGVQALSNTAPDLPPVPDTNGTISRDHEYRRLGTVSILAALDLRDGHVIARVEDRHRSLEFIELLKEIDAHYPAEMTIRLILDNHSAHISKQTRAYLATKPSRFVYVHTPKHGSWLNLAENLFGKMAKTFLRHIRVASVQELKDRILQGVAEMNEQPVLFRWTKFDAAAEAA
jgi:transposase